MARNCEDNCEEPLGSAQSDRLLIQISLLTLPSPSSRGRRSGHQANGRYFSHGRFDATCTSHSRAIRALDIRFIPSLPPPIRMNARASDLAKRTLNSNPYSHLNLPLRDVENPSTIGAASTSSSYSPPFPAGISCRATNHRWLSSPGVCGCNHLSLEASSFLE